MVDTRAVLRSLIWPVFVPSFIYASGTAAVLPVIPLEAIRLGMSPAGAAGLTTLAGLVMMLGPVPTGRLASRIGERRTLMLGAAVAVAALIGMIAFSTTGFLLPFVLCVLLLSVGDLTWDLGRQIYLAEHIPVQVRARAISTFGGSMRVGRTVGPAIGAAVLLAAPPQTVFGLHILCAGIAGLIIVFKTGPMPVRGPQPNQPDAELAVRRRDIAFPLICVALCAMAMSITRINRDLMIPLMGNHLGLTAAVISLAYACCSLVDITLFYPAGIIMDRFGRMAVLLPSLLLMAASFLLFPLAHDIPSFVVLSTLFAFGNGLASGIVKTLGADMTPSANRAQWMGLWNSIVNTGPLLGPALIAGVTVLAGVTGASIATGIVALVGAGWARFWLPRLLPASARGSRRASRADSDQ